MTMSPATSTPSIRIYDSGALHRYPLPHHRRPTYPTQSGAMAIPGNCKQDVPPPLPPPRYIGEQLTDGQDPGWQWGNPLTNNPGFGGVKPGSSLLGGASSGSVHVQSRRERSLDDMSSDSWEPSDEDRGKPRPTLSNHR